MSSTYIIADSIWLMPQWAFLDGDEDWLRGCELEQVIASPMGLAWLTDEPDEDEPNLFTGVTP